MASPPPHQSEALSLITKPSHQHHSPPIGSTTPEIVKRSNGFSIASLVFNETVKPSGERMGVLEKGAAVATHKDCKSQASLSPSPSHSDIDDDLRINVDDDDSDHGYANSVSLSFLAIK